MTTLYHVGVSGGKDSDAVLIYLTRESGIDPADIRASFCDTGNEAAETYAHVAMLSERVHPIETLTPERDFYALALHKGRFPSAKARFCTQKLKMEPTRAHISGLQVGGHAVIAVSGVRASESADRAKLPEWQEPWLSYFGVQEWRPLLHWSLSDVWAIHDRHDVPRNPLYDMGCKRVGCLPCVMSQQPEMLNIARHFPERLDRIRRMEQEGLSSRLGGLTFFAPTAAPLRYRTGPVLPGKAGRMVKVTMIDDVVRRAQDRLGAATIPLAFDDLDEPPTCDGRSGLCE